MLFCTKVFYNFCHFYSSEGDAVMIGKERLMERILAYTEDEKIYKKYHELRGNPEAQKAYRAEIEDYVRDHNLFITDFPFIHIPELFTEQTFLPHLPINRGAHVNVSRHSRYTPVFWHSHTFFTVLYVLTGQCGHKVGDIDLPMTQGDIFFLPPYTKQTIEVFDDSIILNIQIRKDTFDDIFFNTLRFNNILSDFFIHCLYSKEPAKGILFSTGSDEEIQEMFLQIYQETLLNDTYSWRLLHNLVPILFAKLLRGYSDQAVLTGQAATTKNNKLKILSYIHDNYRTVTLEDVAHRFNYSIPHCSKLIRDETGSSFTSFVRHIKMNHAVSLLRNTRISIAEISSLVGYENSESFIRAFQKVYQISPSAYRKQEIDKKLGK